MGQTEEKKKISKSKLLIMAVLWVAFLFGGYSLLDWGFSDHEFGYGDLNYWLLTDLEIRMMPIVGAKPRDVLYRSYYQDGLKPAGISIVYPTRKDSPNILATLKAHFNKLGYLPAASHHLNGDNLQYQGKGYCDQIGVFVQPDTKGSNIVRIDYIMKSAN